MLSVLLSHVFTKEEGREHLEVTNMSVTLNVVKISPAVYLSPDSSTCAHYIGTTFCMLIILQ